MNTFRPSLLPFDLLSISSSSGQLSGGLGGAAPASASDVTPTSSAPASCWAVLLSMTHIARLVTPLQPVVVEKHIPPNNMHEIGYGSDVDRTLCLGLIPQKRLQFFYRSKFIDVIVSSF